MKKGKWAILYFHKGYSIPATLVITKKLTQQYVGPFQIEDKVGWLVYKLKILPNWKIYPVFWLHNLNELFFQPKTLFLAFIPLILYPC